ncbi:MAG: filamentous hemagglutinin N-terminal domain-containing protein, partial [Brevundimonas sp.]
MIKQQDTGTAGPRRRGGSGRTALMLSAGTLAMICAQPALAQVLPTGGVVTVGDASIGSTGAGNVTVTQNSDRVLIDWDSFDIGSGGSVHFDMDATDIAVNRDNAGDPSEIYGTLTGDGMIMILNPNGVLFGAGANVNVGSLVATSASLADVSSNLLSFTGAAGAVTVAAGATITVADAGLAAFVAPSVANNGVITATAGHVFLGGAEGFTLDLANDGLLELTVPTASPLVQNHGDIFAAGGRIQMSAAAASALVGAVINVEGVLSVATASSDDGVIVLEAAGNDIEVSGDLLAEGDIDFVARRVFGAGDVDVDDGALSLNIDPDGADTTGETLIADALGVIGVVAEGTTLNLGAGAYAAGANVTASNVTIDGHDEATILVDGTPLAGLTISGDDVTVRNLNITGPVVGDHRVVDWGAELSTVGIVVNNGAENATLTGNAITNIRTGIRLDGRANAGAEVSGNYIENTKGAILVQYTDGAGLDIFDNSQGPLGNEWGVVLNLNSGTPLNQHATTAAQANIISLSQGNNGMTVMDRGYAWSNRSHVWVDDDSSVTPADDFNYGNGLGNERQALHTVQAGVIAVAAGGTVIVNDGTYVFTSTLNIDKSLSLIGESMNGVFFDGTAIAGYGMEINADNVTLANFTFQGNNASTASSHYGIKVQPDTGDASDRVYDFTIRDVAIQGWGGTELDLNGVVGALIDGVVADGQGTKGVGIALTDSADVTIVNSATLNNLWGSVALYQTNRYYDQQVDNITIDADLNSFAEDIGVFAQSYSDIGLEIGDLNLTGFDFVVRNTGHRSNGDEFTFFRTDLDDAAAFALGLGAAETSSIEGWSGTDYTNVFTVVNGLTIGAAIRDVRDGGFINVGAGTYGGFGTAFGGPADLTITGAEGAIIDGAGVTGRIIDLRADGTTLSGFTIQGDGGGVGVSVSGRGVTVADNTISDVLTGVQTTTQHAAGNAVISGNTITADYGVSLQNTGNAVTGNTVNAAVEGVGLLQGANSFSGNSFTIAAGGDALNYYGSATFAGLVVSGNSVSIEGGGLQGAVDLAGTGGSVDAGAATYNETVTIRHGLTLAGAGMDETFITGGIALTGAISDLTLSGFSVSGNGGSNTVIRNGGVITGLTVDGVRIDGESVAGRFGFIGGQIGGDISITDSEFLNINGWAVFDTRSGAGTNQGSVITSAVFSGNVLDNVQGHVNFRHDIAGGPFPDVVFSNNTVTNVGDATNSFGAIFKAFNADEVTFSDNVVSDVGTSGFNPSGEAAYGAVLMVRGASRLTVTGNTFVNNNMVFAVEPNRGLPTLTTLSGNTFINNGYGLYMPGTAPAGGAVVFGAGNNFVAGADTIQHIVWRSAGALDLTGVLFDGQLAADMSLAEQFALEDLITHGVDVAGAGLATVVDGHLFVTQSSGSIQRAVDLAAAGNTVNVGAGTFGGFATAFGGPADLTIQSVDGAIIDGAGVTGRIIDLRADGTTLS